MPSLTAQNFVSAAMGMAVLAALARGIARRGVETIGNFWVDLTRSTLYILLPLSLLLAIGLVSQGVAQNLSEYQPAVALEGGEQLLPMGSAASQIAIKQLGTNGGGFFNANSAHPLENPTPLSNLLEMLAILLIPAAICYTFGRTAGDLRQGWALLAAMALIFVPCVLLTVQLESNANPTLTDLSVNQTLGNMEGGKETRSCLSSSASSSLV